MEGIHFGQMLVIWCDLAYQNPVIMVPALTGYGISLKPQIKLTNINFEMFLVFKLGTLNL